MYNICGYRQLQYRIDYSYTWLPLSVRRYWLHTSSTAECSCLWFNCADFKTPKPALGRYRHVDTRDRICWIGVFDNCHKPSPPSYDAAGASFSILAGVRSVHMVNGPLNPQPFTFHHTADEFPMSVRFDAEHPLLPGLRRGLGTSFTRQGAGARFALQWRRFQRLVFLNHVLYNILNMNAYVNPTERKEFGRKVSSRVRIVPSRRFDEVRPSRY